MSPWPGMLRVQKTQPWLLASQNSTKPSELILGSQLATAPPPSVAPGMGVMFPSPGERLKSIAVEYISRLVKTKTSSAGKYSVPPPESTRAERIGASIVAGSVVEVGRGSAAHCTFQAPPTGTTKSTAGFIVPALPETASAGTSPGSAAWMPTFVVNLPFPSDSNSIVAVPVAVGASS